MENPRRDPATLGSNIGLNITVMSHCGGLCFGVVADRDLVADAWPLAEELRRA